MRTYTIRCWVSLFQHTAARRRLAALSPRTHPLPNRFNTQPPEGGWGNFRRDVAVVLVSTHSRPKAAGQPLGFFSVAVKFQHTAARRRLVRHLTAEAACAVFQHTAARRRLGKVGVVIDTAECFNTQPPEGGWGDILQSYKPCFRFQHTAARRRLACL